MKKYLIENKDNPDDYFYVYAETSKGGVEKALKLLKEQYTGTFRSMVYKLNEMGWLMYYYGEK